MKNQTANTIQLKNAKLSIWRDAPTFKQFKTAAIGQFECQNADSGANILNEACEALATEGYQAVLGPMDGNTWASYRAVIETDNSPSFLWEPQSPDGHQKAFEKAGFEIQSTYMSSRLALTQSHKNAPQTPPAGVTVRNLKLDDFETELEKLYELSLKQFAKNEFYTPISLAEFKSAYLPYKDYIDPEFIFIGEDGNGAIVGYLFAIRNFTEGPQSNTLILKTYASAVCGLGSFLVKLIHARAASKGIGHIIHALMHENNLSLKHSHNTGAKVFRRYALWGKQL